MAKTSRKIDWMNLRKAKDLFRRLWPYLRPQRWQLALVALGMLLDAVGGAARLLVIKPFMEYAQRVDRGDATDFATQNVVDNLIPWAGLLMAAAISMAVGTLLRQYFSGYVQSRTVINLQRSLLDRVLRQPMTFFNAQRKGALITRLTANSNAAGQLTRIFMDTIIFSPLSMFSIMGVMVYTSPLLALLTFVVLPVVMLPVVMFAAKIRKATKTKYKRLEASGNFFLQTLDGIRVVKSYRLEDAQRQEFVGVSDEVFRKDRRVARYKGFSRFGVELTYNAILAIGLLGAGLLVSSLWFQEIGGLATFMQFFVGLILLYDPMRKLGHALNDVQESTSALDAVFELYDREPEIRDQRGAHDAPAEFSRIEFRGVEFAYEPGRPVLRGIDFTVKRGQMVAFVGQSGMGKSTLMDLIPRFYDPTAGAILIDGTDLREFKLESWLRNIAIVSQETFLFNTTIRQNILAGKPDATEDEVIRAARAAHIWDEIQAMPQGLDTPLGDRGVNLSGGQRQRVAIARAFLRRAPILLLDEATSSLDTNSEREVQKALDELIEGCTVFAIAHRLSTIRNADLILVLSHGRVIESGSHNELVAQNGAYANALRLQQGAETA